MTINIACEKILSIAIEPFEAKRQAGFSFEW
jgi:hypothetical protein